MGTTYQGMSASNSLCWHLLSGEWSASGNEGGGARKKGQVSITVTGVDLREDKLRLSSVGLKTAAARNW